MFYVWKAASGESIFLGDRIEIFVVKCDWVISSIIDGATYVKP